MLRSERGFSLMEVMVAIALLGVIVVAFLGALGTGSKVLFIADERATADSLGRSQMEYVKQQAYVIAGAYDPGPPPVGGQVTYALTTDMPDDSYTIWGITRGGETVENMIYGVPWDSLSGQPAAGDVGLQRVKFIIKHLDKEIITLEDFKVNR